MEHYPKFERMKKYRAVVKGKNGAVIHLFDTKEDFESFYNGVVVLDHFVTSDDTSITYVFTVFDIVVYI
jgi:hypothetical protein